MNVDQHRDSLTEEDRESIVRQVEEFCEEQELTLPEYLVLHTHITGAVDALMKLREFDDPEKIEAMIRQIDHEGEQLGVKVGADMSEHGRSMDDVSETFQHIQEFVSEEE